LLNLKNKMGLISATLALSMLFTVIGGINASADVLSAPNQSFYEDFEGYNGATYTPSTGGIAGKEYQGYPIRVPVGANLTEFKITPVDTTVAQDSTKAGSTAFKMSTKSAQAAAPGIYLNPNMTIGAEDIIVSGDVYIPAINAADGKQYIRFQVTRGITDANKNDMTGWQQYNEFLDPAFGLYIDSSGANAWQASIVAPREDNKVNEYNPKAIIDLNITPETWYNICYVYHPASGGVDYYIDGEFIASHPIGESWATNGKSGTYIMPNLAPGKALGNVVLIGGGSVDEECAAMYDNISVVKASAADEAKYAEFENGETYVFANWDIPALKSTVESATVEVKKDLDVTFSTGTTVDASEYTIDYTASNGVGIQFNTPLTTAYGRYQIKVSGLEDIYGNTVSRVYNFVVGDAITQKATFSETFDSVTNKWVGNNANVTVTEAATAGDRTGVLASKTTAAYPLTQNAIDATYLDIPIVGANVEYVDIAFDLYATIDTTVEGYENSYVNYFMIGHDYGTNFKKAAGISIWHDRVGIVSCAGQDMGADYQVLASSNSAVAGLDQWISYKMRYYPHEGKIDVFAGDMDAPVISATTYNNNSASKTKQVWSALGDGRNSITRFGMQTTKKGSVSYLDNLSIQSYGYALNGAVVKAVTFEDAGGKMLDNKAGAKKMKIYLANAEAAPTVTLNGSPVSGSFELASGVFAADLSTMLVGNIDYTLNINGTDYSFTTGEGRFEVLNLRFENVSGEVYTLTDGDTITAKAEVFNSTDTSETPYLIWVAYNGSEVTWIDLEKIGAISGYADTVVGQTITVTGDYTRVKAFLWDGLSTLVKLTEDCVLERPAAE